MDMEKNKITKEELLKYQNQEVEIRFKHFMGGIGRRVGRLEIDEDWAYVYDEGKSGCHYNGAFHIGDRYKNDIIYIRKIEDMKILILGHMRHGKTTVAEMMLEEYGLTFKDSSMACAEIFIYDELKEKYNYSSFEQCYEDRKQHRDEWFKMICDYNYPDKARLGKEILSRADMYVGMRSNEELQECKKQGIFNLIIGVYRPLFPEEPMSSFDIDIWKECDIVIPNGSDKNELRNRINKLNKLFNEKTKEDLHSNSL